MKNEFSGEGVWTQTSGLSSPWQLETGSALPYLPSNVATVPVEDIFLIIEHPVEPPSPLVPEESITEPPPEKLQLQRAYVNLLGFSPEPDEPGPEDIGTDPRYTFPE